MSYKGRGQSDSIINDDHGVAVVVVLLLDEMLDVRDPELLPARRRAPPRRDPRLEESYRRGLRLLAVLEERCAAGPRR